MWEARAAPGRGRDLAAWAREATTGDVYVSADDRVVVVTDGAALPDPPADLVARAPHVWEFERYAAARPT
jgi:hypothetical protein